MSQIKLTLLDNAHSFIEEALQKGVLSEGDAKQWKFAIFNLVQAIELLLKERLRQEHRIFIFSNIDKPQNTVSIELAIARLKNIAKIEFDQNDLDSLKQVVEWRNQIVHYEFDLKTVELKLRFAKLLGFAAHFHDKFLGKTLDRIVSDEVWEAAVGVLAYGEELFARAQGKFKANDIDMSLVWPCRMCGYEAFVIQDDKNTCYVCGNQEILIQCEKCEDLFYEDETRTLDVEEHGDVTFCKDCIKAMEEEAYWSDYDEER